MILFDGMVSGQEIAVHGAISALGAGMNNMIGADVNLTGSGTVSVGPNSLLTLDGQVTYDGATINGDGRLIQNRDAEVISDTTIDVAIFDWDGNAGGGTTTINSGVILTINSQQIDAQYPATDGFDGTVTVFGGTLAVNTLAGWRMDKVMNLTGGTVTGQEMVVHGALNITQFLALGTNNFINADVSFQSTSTVDVAEGCLLELNGATTYAGGSITGFGTIKQDGGATVTADTTIDVTTFDWDGGGASTTLITGATFTINSSKIDTSSASSDGYDGEVTIFGGTLAVNTNAPWRLDGTMTLAGGTVQGQDMTLYGNLTASPFISGTINTVAADVEFKSTSIVNISEDCTLNFNGQTTYAGGAIIGNGTLVQNGDATVSTDTTIFTATFDWDGGTGTSATTIDPGVTLTINSSKIDTAAPLIDGFDGTINLGSGAALIVNPPSPWRMEGTLNMTNAGSIPTVSGSKMVVSGTLAVTSGLANINSGVEFESGAFVTIPAGAGLQLKSTALIYNGSTFSGGGDLIVATGATLGIENGMSLSVDMVNNGTVDLGSSPGIVEITGDFTQNIAGLLNIEIAGTDNSNPANPQFDALRVTGNVTLDGFLDVVLFGGFDPVNGDTFDILDWGKLNSTFNKVILPDLVPGLFWNTIDLYNTGEISVAALIPGDANRDGQVSAGDYASVQANFGNTGAPNDPTLFGDANLDGQVSAGDYASVQANFGNVAAAQVTPEPATLSLLTIGGIAMLRRKRK